MLKWILKNKYKAMVLIIIGLYIGVDGIKHKGLTRTLLPKTFVSYKTDSGLPKNNNTLINAGREWVKAINTKELINAVDKKINGLECDVYFDTEKKIYDVHHELGMSIGWSLDSLLEVYRKRELQASIWLDFKNLNDSNYNAAAAELISIRNKYGMANRFLVESNRADLLTVFSDSGFFTSYYTPMFNPYRMNNDEMKHWVDSLSAVINISKVSALSGYYFQYPFLHHYFPNYPILTWLSTDRFSLISWLAKRKVTGSKEVFIVLGP